MKFSIFSPFRAHTQNRADLLMKTSSATQTQLFLSRSKDQSRRKQKHERLLCFAGIKAFPLSLKEATTKGVKIIYRKTNIKRFRFLFLSPGTKRAKIANVSGAVLCDSSLQQEKFFVPVSLSVCVPNYDPRLVNDVSPILDCSEIVLVVVLREKKFAAELKKL